MNDLEQMLKARAELDAKIQAAQVAARENAIAQVQELMARHGLTMVDVSGRPSKVPKASKPSGGKVPAKYRDKEGNAWTGRGLKPKWLSAALAKGAQLSDFAI